MPAPRGATRKRKRALPRNQVDTESDEDTVEDGAMKAATLERVNKAQALELANAMGRTAAMQNQVDELQSGFAQSVSMNEEMRRREAETTALHAMELR